MAERQVVMLDATVICPAAISYVNGAVREAGTAAEVASCKEAKYTDIDEQYVFEPTAVENDPWRL